VSSCGNVISFRLTLLGKVSLSRNTIFLVIIFKSLAFNEGVLFLEAPQSHMMKDALPCCKWTIFREIFPLLLNPDGVYLMMVILHPKIKSR
ncbi:hypothetical protein, partial [Klebsiella michiganensis]|uniref:hypothetical protein n=1 Tax=Klebsiella michiganensis TaxID=1134687 RepID=UPI001FFD4F6D